MPFDRARSLPQVSTSAGWLTLFTIVLWFAVQAGRVLWP